MGIPDLTIEVPSLSPSMTFGDLILFFSYCGTVKNIELEISLNKDQHKSALVTFNQPYAYQTALLLDGAIFAGQPIRVLPWKNLAHPSRLDKLINLTENHMVQDINPAKQAVIVQEMGFEGTRKLNGAVNEMDNSRILEKGRELIHRTGYNIFTAEQAAGNKATRITNGEHGSSGTAGFSTMFGKASKAISELGTSRKKNNPNSRKQK